MFSFWSLYLSLQQVFFHALGISAQASALMTIAYERYHTISNPFEKVQIKKRCLFLASSCWIMAVILATLQLLLARNTITHDICRKVPIKVYKTGSKYLVIAYGLVSFVMIVIYYIGIMMLVKKHLNQFDQKLNADNSTKSAAGNGPTPSGRIEPISIVDKNDPGSQSVKLRREASSVTKSPTTNSARKNEKVAKGSTQLTPSSLQVPKNVFVFSGCSKVTPALDIIPTISGNVQGDRESVSSAKKDVISPCTGPLSQTVGEKECNEKSDGKKKSKDWQPVVQWKVKNQDR